MEHFLSPEDRRKIHSTLQHGQQSAHPKKEEAGITIGNNITIHGLQNLSAYDPYWLQHYQTKKVTTLSPQQTVPSVPLVIFPFCMMEGSWDHDLQRDSTAYHLFQDGLNHSRVLRRVPQHASLADMLVEAGGQLSSGGGIVQLDPHVVWMVAQNDRRSSRRLCVHVTREIQVMQVLRAQLGLPTQWPIVFTQFTDGNEAFRCAAAEELMGDTSTTTSSYDFVSYVRRSVVKGRRWVESNRSMDLGTIDYGFTRHSPIPVRTDTLASIDHVLRTQYASSGIHRDIESELRRPIDVSHFWPVHGQTFGLVGYGANLRRETTNRLLRLQEEYQELTIFSSIVGRDPQDPLTTLSDDHSYPAKMLESKM